MKKFIKNSNKSLSILKYALYVTPVLLGSIDAFAAFNLENGIKAATDPVKSVIDNYYTVAIFVTGAIGALMQQQGDLRVEC